MNSSMRKTCQGVTDRGSGVPSAVTGDIVGLKADFLPRATTCEAGRREQHRQRIIHIISEQRVLAIRYAGHEFVSPHLQGGLVVR